MSIYGGLSPSAFSLPSKFAAFRLDQTEAMEWAAYSDRAFLAACLPTGSGKSLFAVAVAKAAGVKAVYLTATRGLQDQVFRDFSSCGMVDVRGRQNYQCNQMYIGLKRQASCDYGHTHECGVEYTRDCPYSTAVVEAEESDLVVTNYAYWMHSRRHNACALESKRRSRPVELLICDEAGDVHELMSDFVSIKINFNDEQLPFSYYPRRMGMQDGGLMPEADWSRWAAERFRQAVEESRHIRSSYSNKEAAMKDDRFVYLQELVEKCKRIQMLSDGWTWEMNRDGACFTPVWPGRYSSALWSGVPRVLLMSATLRPYTLGLLGLGKEDYDFREWPPCFPPHLGPVYHLSSGVRLNWKSTDADYDAIIASMDSVLDARPDRRALVHTVSYARQKRILNRSRHAARMVFNEAGRDTNRAAENFRSGPDNAVLVSPSFSTGFDFPDEQCEVNIILKVPYPNTTSRVTAERCKDPDYRMHVTVQELVQMVGRPRRHAKDRAETFILDDAISWVMGSGRNPWHGHAPAGFRVQTISSVPPAPPRIARDLETRKE